MYAWYTREYFDEKLVLEFEEQVSLFGCNSGIIANELREILSLTDNANMGWMIPIAGKWNKEDYSFIIDIKPNTDEVLICELDTVFGYSYNEWSPIMLRLKVLTTDEEIDKNKFHCQENPYFIYTMLYLNGSIRNGKTVGTWNAPFGSITAVLFWPEAMSFFYDQVKQIDPHFLTQEIQLIQAVR